MCCLEHPEKRALEVEFSPSTSDPTMFALKYPPKLLFLVSIAISHCDKGKEQEIKGIISWYMSCLCAFRIKSVVMADHHVLYEDCLVVFCFVFCLFL